MENQVRKQSFLLRLPTSLRDEATLLAHEEGTSLNHFISLAVAEKISRLEAGLALRAQHQQQGHRLQAGPQPVHRMFKAS